MTGTTGGSSGTKIAGALLAIALFVALGLLFLIVLLVVQPIGTALLTVGILALVLALLSYLAQAFSREPIAQRLVAWTMAAIGFATLLTAIWIVPGPNPSPIAQLVGTLVVVVLLVITVALGYWRVRSVGQTQAREEHRAAWDQSRPPSAFDYAAAQAPGTGSAGGPSPPNQRSP